MTATNQIEWTEGRAENCGAGRWAVLDDGVMSYVAPIGDRGIESVTAAALSAYSADHAALCEVSLYVDGQPGGVEYTCPHCGRINRQATDDGATDGPREYHADCWRAAADDMTDAEVRAAWDASPLPG